MKQMFILFSGAMLWWLLGARSVFAPLDTNQEESPLPIRDLKKKSSSSSPSRSSPRRRSSPSRSSPSRRRSPSSSTTRRSTTSSTRSTKAPKSRRVRRRVLKSPKLHENTKGDKGKEAEEGSNQGELEVGNFHDDSLLAPWMSGVDSTPSVFVLAARAETSLLNEYGVHKGSYRYVPDEKVFHQILCTSADEEEPLGIDTESNCGDELEVFKCVTCSPEDGPWYSAVSPNGAAVGRVLDPNVLNWTIEDCRYDWVDILVPFSSSFEKLRRFAERLGNSIRKFENSEFCSTGIKFRLRFTFNDKIMGLNDRKLETLAQLASLEDTEQHVVPVDLGSQDFQRASALNLLHEAACHDATCLVVVIDIDLQPLPSFFRNALTHARAGSTTYFPIMWSEHNPKSVRAVEAFFNSNGLVLPEFSEHRGIWRKHSFGMYAIAGSDLESFEYDESFVGWGGEDGDFFDNIQSELNVVRMHDYGLIHLWHPKSCDEASVGEGYYMACMDSKASVEGSTLGVHLINLQKLANQKSDDIVGSKESRNEVSSKIEEQGRPFSLNLVTSLEDSEDMPNQIVHDSATSSPAIVRQEPLRVIWLNLDWSLQRRHNMERMLGAVEKDGNNILLVNHTRFSAVDAPDALKMWQDGKLVLPGITLVDSYEGDLPEWKERRLNKKYKLTEAACLVSHLAAILQAYKEGQDTVLILEDDAVVSNTFLSEWKSYTDLAPNDWKVLQWVTNNEALLKQGLNMQDPWVSWTPAHYSTRAYLLNRDGMREIVTATHSLGPGGEDQWNIPEGMLVADEVLYYVAHQAYTSTHPWVDSSDSPSTIQTTGDHHASISSLESYSTSLALKDFKPRHESILVLSSARFTSFEQITKGVERIQVDVQALCAYHLKCTWAVQFVITDIKLEDDLKASLATVPSNVHWKYEVNPGVFNKFAFVETYVSMMGMYDYVLLKDSDQRIAGLPWNTFMTKKGTSVVSGVLREAIEESLLRSSGSPKRQWFKFHDAQAWKEQWKHPWASQLVANIQPVEVTILEMYFVLFEGEFAQWFFSRILTPDFTLLPNAWGPDLMWCKAAKEFRPSQTPCSLVPIVSSHEDTREIVKEGGLYQSAGPQTIVNFRNNPMFNDWMTYSDGWKKIIGGSGLQKVKAKCNGILGDKGFDLESCIQATVPAVTKVPNIMFIGTQKSGSSALAQWLFKQKSVCGAGDPKHYTKEVHFISRWDPRKVDTQDGLELYSQNFRNCPADSFILDATPNTFLYPARVRKLYDAAGLSYKNKLKILVTLREPVARELSIYNHMAHEYRHKGDGWWGQVAHGNGTIKEFGEYVDSVTLEKVRRNEAVGMYAFHLHRWLKSFDREQILILSYAELKHSPDDALKRVQEFIGLDEPEGNMEQRNTKEDPEKVSLPPCDVQQQLASRFEPLNDELYALLDQHPGPSMEQRPFPQFELSNCVSKGDSLVINSSSSTASTNDDSTGGNAWCPSAMCSESFVCQPCQRRFLILITTGRSASTTLTWMLDSLPGVRMSGENNDFIGKMQNISMIVEPAVSVLEEKGQSPAWGRNHIPEDSHTCALQSLLELIIPPEEEEYDEERERQVILGFKTIRFLGGGNMEEIKRRVEYVKKVLPCVRILVNIRSDTNAQALSQKASFEGSYLRKDLEQIQKEAEDKNRMLRQVADLFGEQAMLLDSSEWTKDVANLNQAVEWLGYDKACFFRDILKFNTESNKKGKGYWHGKTKLDIMNPGCRYLG